jgi:asparagine synthase (glutamine-hydrolysing)
MCGIAGFIDFYQKGDPSGNPAICAGMTDAIKHRGPDAAGIWQDRENRVVLGHRRLSIIDLSESGAQPMRSHSGNLSITYNGEIYNYLEIRDDLEAEFPRLKGSWRGHSDTEVLLEAIELWGIEKTLEAANGMFAFALWDKTSKKLFMARDRLGKKPLYYGISKGVFLFASELKAIRAHPAFEGRIDRGALTAYLRHGCVPSPHCIFQGFKKLPPGCFVVYQPRPGPEMPRVREYWSLAQAMEKGSRNPFTGSPKEAVDTLSRLLEDAVRIRMISDVPLGALLSGGIDSSAVVALMTRCSPGKVRTFSIGFHEGSHNEAPYAKEVAEHLGTEHTELYVSQRQALEVTPMLPSLYDEPFADSSQIPTFLVSRMARQAVTVALSGDGGDEAFCGYDRYMWASRFKRLNRRIPRGIRAAFAGVMRRIPVETMDALLKGSLRILPQRFHKTRPADNLDRLWDVLGMSGDRALYQRIMSLWADPEKLVRQGHEPDTVFSADATPCPSPDFLRQMMYWDIKSYLPDDILTKVDRASMGVSLEMRAPILDWRVIEFAQSLPLDIMHHKGLAKWPLRQLAYHHLPVSLLERPKMGFGVPIADWLRGPLRSWAEELLEPSRLQSQGHFRVEPVRTAWREHLKGRVSKHHQLWAVLMFQAWLEDWESV